MKNWHLKFFILFFILKTNSIIAQVPQKMSYQAVIRNASNNLVANSPVGLRFSILQGSATGTAVYVETHRPTTNINGLASVDIGSGTVVSGTFSTINWSTGTYFLKTETDPNGGTTYSIVGTSQLLTVPYAFVADRVLNPAGNNGYNSLIKPTYIVPGFAGCRNGGFRIEFGLDINRNGILDVNEINGQLTKYVCNGMQGAQGPQGVGITSTVDNGNGTFTFFYSDGSAFTTSNLTGQTGPQGATGPAGVGIISTINNGNGTYTFNYSDGSAFTTSNLTGPQGATGPQGPTGLTGPQGATGQQGPAGANGVSITNSFVQGDSLYVTLSSGQTLNTGYVRGPQGIQGPQGQIGLTGPQGATGATGPAGPQGLQGATGLSGTNGVSVTNSFVQGDSLYVVLSNGQTLNTGYVRGPQGATGATGAQGATGPQGPIGSTGPQGATGLTGPQGAAGANGVSITNSFVQGDSLYVTLSNGQTLNTGYVRGPQGIQGPQGQIGLTGPQGATGATGPAGPQGLQGATGLSGTNGVSVTNSFVQGDSLYVALSNGQTLNTGYVRGPQGFLINGSQAGNTAFWNGSQWVLNGLNFYNNGTNIGIGTTNPDLSSITEMNSTTQGFLPPRMTNIQRDAIVAPANGLIIFNTSSGCPNYFSNGTWYEWCGTGVLPNGILASLSCGTATNNGTLSSGVVANGVSSVIPYSGGNGGTHNGQTVTSTGVTGLTATLVAGTFANGAGTLTYTITGTPASIGTASFALNIGGQNCVLTRAVTLPVGVITTLSCGTATNTGTLTQGNVANGVSSSVPYTGGNGGTHNGQTVASTGVTGLTATLAAGTFANGAGSLTYNISGTPATSGTASFALNIGGQNCVLNISIQTLVAFYPAGTVFCNGPTAVVDVTNPATGKIWMDRNLGASQVATSSTDAQAYGDLYQWGRRSDGHQCRNSANTTTLSSIDQPANGNFIIVTITPNDWRNPQNNNLWQGVNGVNNPCPSGYRLPTETELDAERLSWISNNSTGAFASPLKLPMAGNRNRGDGSIVNGGLVGHYWSSTVSSTMSRDIAFDTNAQMLSYWRAFGFSVRCIKD